MNDCTSKNAYLLEYHVVIKNMVTETMWHKENVDGILITIYYLLSP